MCQFAAANHLVRLTMGLVFKEATQADIGALSFKPRKKTGKGNKRSFLINMIPSGEGFDS